MKTSPSRQIANPEWLVRIRAGDESTFEALFHAFVPGLCAFVAGHVGSREVAEEIVQDLFLALWRRREKLVIESSVSNYLYSAARNRAFDWLKRERTARVLRDRVIGTIDERDLNAPDESELLELLELQDAIDHLPPRCRLIFTLSRQHDMTYAEIAESLGLSVRTVEVQIGRALKILRGPSHIPEEMTE
jgi:RNA polymerase sigma-70 factor (ECF subfamily)